jgi:hypothetical protein
VYTISLTVKHIDDGSWVITHTDNALITKTEDVRAHYDAEDVLRVAERMASGDVLWRLTEGGFEGVVRRAVTGWPL